jgi:hypothetical protein
MKKQKTETPALTTQSPGFVALANKDFMAMIGDEMDGLDIGFERIKIPSGGVTMFEMPAEDGDETESVKEFSGVILYHHVLNAFYRSKYTGGSNPPDCGSFDGTTGTGDPGGNCKSCPYNQFGTGENGSKACKNRRRVYILREGEVFPLLLSLPTGSLKAFTRYIKQQLSKGRKLNSVVTRFSLKKAINAGGIAYSQAVFTLDRNLTPEEHTFIESLSEQIKAYSGQVGLGFDAETVAHEDIPADSAGEEIQPLGANCNG